MAIVGNPDVKPDGTANAEGDEQVQLLASAAEAAAIVNKMRGVKA